MSVQTSVFATLLAGTLGAAILPAGFAFAQSADDELAVDEIIVTASRRALSLQETPLAVTAIDPGQLANSGLDKVREVIEYTPGVFYSGGSLPTAHTVTMRGVAQLGRSSTVAVYLDEIPLGSQTSFASGPSLHFDGVQGDIERIELIRGPQGTLYGSSAMGGVVRYITTDPLVGEFQGNLNVDYSSVAHGSTGNTVRGRVSLPLVRDKLGLSVAGYRQDYGGFIDRLDTTPTGAAEDVDSFDTSGVYAKLLYKPTERFTASLLAVSTETETNGANYIALQGPPFEPVNGKYMNDEGANDIEDSFDIVGLTLKYDFDTVRLVSSTSHQERSNAAVADLVATFGPLVDLLSGNPTGTNTAAPFTGATETERFVQELRLESAGSGKLEWTVGAYYSSEESGNLQKLEGEPTGFVALDVDLASWLDETAGFGKITWSFSDAFDVGVGIRLASIDSAVALTDIPQIIVANLPKTSSKDTVTTYSLTSRYRPSENQTVYMRIANGYRPENANLPLLDVEGNNAAPAIIATDELWSYEIGTKGQVAGSGFGYDLSAYYIAWDEPQVVTYVNGASTGGNANSDVTAYGFEATGTYKTAGGLNLIGAVSYVHSTLDSDETASLGALEGEELAQLPSVTASLRMNYDFHYTDRVAGFVAGGFRYVDSRHSGYKGGIGSNGEQIDPLITNFTMDEYVVADFGIGFRAERFSGKLFANNLFDEYGFTSGSARPAVGFTRATATVLQPRTIGVSLSVDF